MGGFGKFHGEDKLLSDNILLKTSSDIAKQNLCVKQNFK